MMDNKEHYIEFKSLEDQSPQAFLLKELLENGLAERESGSVFVPHEEICKLSSIDQKIFGLPEVYPFDIRIDSFGLFSDSNMQLKLAFYEYNHGDQLLGTRKGCILSLQDQSQYLLSLEQYQLCEAVDEFNSISPKDFSDCLIKFSDIKQLSRKSAAILDSYLDSEQIIVPNKISLKLEIDEKDNLSFLPDIDTIQDSEVRKSFERKFDHSDSVRSSYTATDRSGKRVRIPFTRKQRDGLRDIKKYRKVKGELKNKILENPEDFFDPDIIDLDNFSRRVIDIGIYKPRYFPFISPYKSEWIPGIIIDDGKEKSKIMIRDKSELFELERAYKDAVSNNMKTISWRNRDFPISQAKDLIEFSKSQFDQPNKPIKTSGDGKKVLIIEDNIYEDKYHEDKKQPVPLPEFFFHNYEKPITIKDDILLYEHQKEGIAWFESLFKDNYSGGVLADDMGLGKTLQILSFIDWHNSIKNEERKPYLIVAPVTLLENWENEYKRFFLSKLEMISLYGLGKEWITPNNLRKHNIFLVNYEAVRNARNQLVFGQIDWAVVVLDEAQKVKTPGTLVTNAVKALKSDFKIAATGTPVENSMVDLWCIVDFVVPGLLGSAKYFSKKYQTPMRKDISDEELNQLGENLRNEIGLYLKRRLKQDILIDLPDKVETRKKTIMPEYQKNMYIQQIKNRQSSKKGEILSAIINLKKISDHPCLMGYDYQMISSQKLIEDSAKLKITINILEEIKLKKEKAIIFAEFKETQRILRKVIQNSFNLTDISVINGEMTARRGTRSQKETRQEAIDRFELKSGFNVIIMSPIVAGLGLNVTAANHVIHYTRHWNPAKESQATDRAYRIGQRKNVFIYFPIAELQEFKTFDVIIDSLLKQKRNLADAAMFPSALCEVNVTDFSKEIPDLQNQEIREENLALDDFDQFEPIFFEAAIATIFKQKGYNITLTPKSNDKGADIVVMSENQNWLIQVKQARSPINDQAVGEVLKAKGYYEDKYKTRFSLKIATNRTLNQNALIIAENNQVEVFDRTNLEEYIQKNKIYLSNIQSVEMDRAIQI